MTPEIIIAIIGAGSALGAAAFGYMKGRGNPKLDQFQAIRESFESLIDSLKSDNADLRQECSKLRQENADLRLRIIELEGGFQG